MAKEWFARKSATIDTESIYLKTNTNANATLNGNRILTSLDLPGPDAPLINAVPNFHERNVYTPSASVNVNGDLGHMALDLCNGSVGAAGVGFSQEGGLGTYIKGVPNVYPGGTKWICQKEGIFLIDCSMVLDQQNTTALYGIALEVNAGGDISLRSLNATVTGGAFLEETTYSFTTVLPMKAGDFFTVRIIANQPLNVLVSNAQAKTNLSVMQIL